MFSKNLGEGFTHLDEKDIFIQQSLERLHLCNKIRELADYHTPVTLTDLAHSHGLLAGITQFILKRDYTAYSKINLLKRVLIYPIPLILLRLLLAYCGLRSDTKINVLLSIEAAIKLAYRKVRYSYLEIPPSKIPGYIRCTDKEEPLIRICSLLRVMKRYAVCIDFLIQRFNSGLPAAQTRHLLSLFLHEIGDTEAAAVISPPLGRPEPNEDISRINASKPRRLKYGVVMATMFDSDVFRSSLLSLLKSDFSGEIVVVEEGNCQEKVCESFCKQLPVKYVKNPRWSNMSGTYNLGIEQLAKDIDIVILSSNDVLWPPKWFSQLDQAWEKVYDLDKVAVINLGFMHYNKTVYGSGLDLILYDLFIRGEYKKLIWIIRTMGDVFLSLFQNVEVKDRSRLFGLGGEPWINSFNKLAMMTGKFSIGASFPLKFWQEMGGFDPELTLIPDIKIIFISLLKRKWILWINNPPLIHLTSRDTNNLNAKDRQKIVREDYNEACAYFFKKFGWDFEHIVCTFFSETTIIYFDEIINAINEMKFADIDFIFDDFFKRLENKRLSSCDINFCERRKNCRYR